MRLIKRIVPAVLIAVLALLAPPASAQTMGEYAGTTAGAGTAGGWMSTNTAPTSTGSSDIGGGSSTWGASELGASFDERAGAASPFSAGADFESRAGSATRGLTGESRWPESALDTDTSTRLGDSSDRFPDQDRFPDRAELSSADRFPARSLNDNPMGLDTHYNAANNY
jgi:hypothetical protein